MFIYYQNDRSVCNKLSTLRSNLLQLTVTPKIIIISETWLKPHIMASELGLNHYDLYRCDRTSAEHQQGGEILIAVHNSLTSRQLDFALQSDSIFLEVKVMDKFFVIAATYMPPDFSTNVYNDFASYLEEISLSYRDYEFVVCGDFNLADIKWSNNPLSFS